MGVPSIFGRVFAAALPANKVGKEIYVIFYFFSVAIFSLSLFLLAYVGPEQFVKTAVLITFFGFMVGAFFVAMPALLAEIGGEYSVVMIGFATFAAGCGSLIGAITAGKHCWKHTSSSLARP